MSDSENSEQECIQRMQDAIRRFQDKGIFWIGVALLVLGSSWAFLFAICHDADSASNYLTHALRRAQCADAREAWRELGIVPWVTLGFFPVLLLMRAIDRRGHKKQ